MKERDYSFDLFINNSYELNGCEIVSVLFYDGKSQYLNYKAKDINAALKILKEKLPIDIGLFNRNDLEDRISELTKENECLKEKLKILATIDKNVRLDSDTIGKNDYCPQTKLPNENKQNDSCGQAVSDDNLKENDSFQKVFLDWLDDYCKDAESRYNHEMKKLIDSLNDLNKYL